MRRRIVLLCLVLLAGLSTGIVWLGGSTGGLQTVARWASGASGGQLQIEQVRGRLFGPLSVGRVHWQSPTLDLQLEQLQGDWSPAALLDKHLHISELQIDRISISTTPDGQAAVAPQNLRLPLAMDLDQIAIGQLTYAGLPIASELAGRLSSDGQQHRLSDFRGKLAAASFNGQAHLDGNAPLPMEASLELVGQLENHPLALSLSASGPLARLALSAKATAGLHGEAQIVLTPFSPAAFASAQISLDQIDPAAWHASAPSARLQLHAKLTPQGDGVAGDFSLHNQQPGRIEQQRLPLNSLSGRIDWQKELTRFDALRLVLPGNGELIGEARWQTQQLSLELDARKLDAAQISSSLRSTRLQGPISATLGTDQQALKLQLQDPRFKLRLDATHHAGQLRLAALELQADQAPLMARGELELQQEMRFSTEGELRHFDPSRFVQAPSADINAGFKAQGRLAKQPQINAAFEVKESRLAKQTLTGHGKLSVDWPRIPLADIVLLAGPNRLGISGAYGRAGDVLRLDLDAPQLSPYGIKGGIGGQIELRGSVQRPELNARFQAATLGWPGLGQLSDLNLVAELGSEPASALKIDLGIGQISDADQTPLAKQLQLQGKGQNQAHQFKASIDLPETGRLTAALSGGVKLGDAGPRWQGSLDEAQLNARDQKQSVKLARPAPLAVSARDWSLGPAQLHSDHGDWQAQLQAEADPKQLHASLKLEGRRLGQIDGELRAGMLGPWSLDPQAPWQAQFNSHLADLGWLAEMIGQSWQSEGRFNGELKLGGTPARPVANGRFRGEQLALRLPEQGLNLNHGELLIELDDNLLRVKKLGFDSILQPLPRPLRLAAKDVTARLQTPGRLEISGEMRVDRSKGAEQAFLDIRLNRLGAYQLPDQWIAVSGDGRLTWQGDTLGAKGRLGVDAGYWQLAPAGAPKLSDDVVIKGSGSDVPSPSRRPKIDLDITTNLGQNFFFRGAGLSSRLSGDLRLRASGRDLPRASGSIRTHDGRFDAYGQQLEIERGILTFQGLLDNPGLDVRAVRKGLSVEPGVQISGNAQKPQIKLISDPALPEAEKLSWLVLGHGPEQMGAGDATVLLAAAGGLLGNDSGKLVQQLKATFGIDEFGLRQGDISGTGGRQPGSRVAASSSDPTAASGNQIFSVGKRLSSNALLSYEQSLGKAESIVKLTVNLTRRISVIGRAGSDNALDIFYTLTFGRAPRSPAQPASRAGVD